MAKTVAQIIRVLIFCVPKRTMNRHRTLVSLSFQDVNVATPAEPRGENKKHFFVQILGGEKLLEECR